MPNNDADCDGTLTVDDCDDNDADSTIVSEDSDCDGVPDGCFLADCDISVDLGNGIGADFVLIEGENLVDQGGEGSRYTLENVFTSVITEVTQGMFFALMNYHSYKLRTIVI